MFLYFPQDAEVEKTRWQQQTGHRGWSFQMAGLISDAHYGGGYFAELHQAGQSTVYGNNDTWWARFTELARRVQALAEQAEAESDLVTAHNRYLRAANYFDTSEMWLEADDERLHPTYDNSVHCYRKAFDLANPPIERVRVPYEGDALAAYFLPSPTGDGGPAPTVVFFGGADNICENLYFKTLGIRQRGLNFLLIDGPGQGHALRKKDLKMRPDWEAPAGAAYDYVASRPDVDEDSIALMGISLGGNLAPRAAANDARWAGVVCWAINTNPHEVWMNRPDDHPLVHHYKWFMGIEDVDELREELKKYSLDEHLPNIECPVLLLMGEKEGELRMRQAAEAMNKIRAPKQYRIVREAETGSQHCQVDNTGIAQEIIGDWLVDVLIRKRNGERVTAMAV